MKKQVTQKKSFNKKPGFTLVEVAIAIGMMAVMISSFMVVFGPSIKGIDKSLSAKEADRLTSALELELNVLRNGEVDNNPATIDKFATTFEKAFWWIKDSARTDADRHPVLIYQYRGNPNNVRDDGTLEPLYDNGTNTIRMIQMLRESIMSFKHQQEGSRHLPYRQNLRGALHG